MKCYDASFWKNEYENLRRHKKKEIEELKYQLELAKVQQSISARKTYDLLKTLGMKDKDIFDYYKR